MADNRRTGSRGSSRHSCISSGVVDRPGGLTTSSGRIISGQRLSNSSPGGKSRADSRERSWGATAP
eukprot:5360532-Lingulodinium_polyedra.AAC.1